VAVAEPLKTTPGSRGGHQLPIPLPEVCPHCGKQREDVVASLSAPYESLKGVSSSARGNYESILEFTIQHYITHPWPLALNIFVTIILSLVGLWLSPSLGAVIGAILGLLWLFFGPAGREKVREINRRI
jgi:hypothetical protein